MKTPKRFIAGAICPCCKEIDKLVMWTEEKIPHRECMSCGFADIFDKNIEQSNSSEIKTRVSPRVLNEKKEKVIHFFPSPQLSKKS